jgi:sigma-B regulation protein RsbU (phosphoserine phosphatase)
VTTAQPAELQQLLLDEAADELYDTAPCGYLSTAPSGLIVKVNQTFAQMTGYTRDELVGRRTFPQLLTVGSRLYHETHYAPMLHMQGQAREIALDLVRRDGRPLPVLVNAQLVRDAAGAPLVVRAAVLDATQRRSYEQELLLARRRAEDSEQRARELVRTLQQVLVPPAPPRIRGLDVAGVYRPARRGEEVGGDFYDVFQVGADAWAVVIGDVCGKGVEAAIVTSLLRHTIREAVVAENDLPTALARVNRALLDHAVDRSSTVAALSLSRTGTGWSAVVCCAGHPLPLLARHGTVEQVGEPGTLLGILPDPAFRQVRLDLTRGDEILLFTDGITEGRHGPQSYGVQRLRDNLQRGGASAHELGERLVEDAVDFQDGVTRDDIAVVVVRVSD